jgi:hypothetical protein
MLSHLDGERVHVASDSWEPVCLLLLVAGDRRASSLVSGVLQGNLDASIAGSMAGGEISRHSAAQAVPTRTMSRLPYTKQCLVLYRCHHFFRFGAP